MKQQHFAPWGLLLVHVVISSSSMLLSHCINLTSPVVIFVFLMCPLAPTPITQAKKAFLESLNLSYYINMYDIYLFVPAHDRSSSCFILFVYALCDVCICFPLSVHQCPCWSICAQPCSTQMKHWRLQSCTCGSNCLGDRQPSLCPLPSGTECVSCCCRPWPMQAPRSSSKIVLVRKSRVHFIN